MKTILLDNSNNPVIAVNINGLSTLSIAGNPRSISQLVKLRLMMVKRDTKYQPYDVIDWFLMMNSRKSRAVLGTKVRALITETQEVTSVDLSKAQYDLDNTIKLDGVCFSIGGINESISI